MPKKSKHITTIPRTHPRQLSILTEIRMNYIDRLELIWVGNSERDVAVYARHAKDVKEIQTYVAGIFAGLKMA